jgi:hypothetical protein
VHPDLSEEAGQALIQAYVGEWERLLVLRGGVSESIWP